MGEQRDRIDSNVRRFSNFLARIVSDARATSQRKRFVLESLNKLPASRNNNKNIKGDLIRALVDKVKEIEYE